MVYERDEAILRRVNVEGTRALDGRRIGHAPVWLARLLKGTDPVRAATRSAKSSNAKIRALGWSPAYPS